MGKLCCLRYHFSKVIVFITFAIVHSKALISPLLSAGRYPLNDVGLLLCWHCQNKYHVDGNVFTNNENMSWVELVFKYNMYSVLNV